MPRIKVKIDGIDEIRNRLGVRGAKALGYKVDKVTEFHTLKMANDAANNAPERDRHLKNSITASPKRLSKGAWQFGSDRPYAQRQEYEHKTRKGFFRKALWNGRNPFRNDIRDLIRNMFGR